MKTYRLRTALLALALVLAACAGSEPTSSTVTSDSPGTTTSTLGASTTNPTGGTEAVEVTIEDMSFQPATVSVAPGQEVTWTNNDGITHTVTFDDGTADVRLAAGESTTVTITEPGEHTYHCAIHPSMKGSVTVTG